MAQSELGPGLPAPIPQPLNHLITRLRDPFSLLETGQQYPESYIQACSATTEPTTSSIPKIMVRPNHSQHHPPIPYQQANPDRSRSRALQPRNLHLSPPRQILPATEPFPGRQSPRSRFRTPSSPSQSYQEPQFRLEQSRIRPPLQHYW